MNKRRLEFNDQKPVVVDVKSEPQPVVVDVKSEPQPVVVDVQGESQPQSEVQKNKTPRRSVSTALVWDKKLTKKLQRHFGVEETGVIQNQDVSLKEHLPSAGDGFEFSTVGRYGSLVVRRLQKSLGLEATGQFDSHTVTRIRRWIGLQPDTILDADVVKALEEKLETLNEPK